MSITSAKTGATGISLALDNNFMEPIATTLISSSGITTVSFLDIPQTYKHLHLRIFAKGANTGNGVGTGSRMIFNNDSLATNYWRHGINAYASGISSNNANDYDFWDIIGSSTGLTSMFAINIIDIPDYTNPNKNKVTRNLVGEDTNGNGSRLGPAAGIWNNTQPITSITLISMGGNLVNGSRFSLYGIKG
jgi:hypothetical protein